MNPRFFTRLIGDEHTRWLGNLLGLKAPSDSGIDLSDDNVGIEVKSRYKKYSKRWAVHDYQIQLFKQENDSKSLFWAFVLYNLIREPFEIKHNRVGMYVRERDAYIIPWDFLLSFPRHETKTGPYRYVGAANFENFNFRRIEKKGGVLYVPVNCVLEDRI